MSAHSSWWRRNRWGLVALPFALAVALAAGSSRLHDYWWVQGFHRAAPVSDGVASLDDAYDDGHLRYPIEARYSVASFTPDDITLYGGDPIPTGLRAWRLHLSVEADPDVVLAGCQVAVVDTDGNLYGDDDSGLDLAEVNLSSCVPEDTPGPQAKVGSTAAPELAPGTEPRPDTFTTDTVFVLPQEAKPAHVRLWYGLPDYVELPVGPAAG